VEVTNSGQIVGFVGVSVVDGVSELVLNNSGSISTFFEGVRNTNGRLNISNAAGAVIETTSGTIAINSIQDRTDPGLNFDDLLVNSGTITGDVILGAGNDTVRS
ncbi:unnamed protein product, partial [Ectocarpus sp. 12 AP-2014]